MLENYVGISHHLNKCYCKILQSFPEIFLETFSKERNIKKWFQKDFLERFFYETENVNKYFQNLAKIFHEKL